MKCKRLDQDELIKLFAKGGEEKNLDSWLLKGLCLVSPSGGLILLLAFRFQETYCICLINTSFFCLGQFRWVCKQSLRQEANTILI